MRAIAFDVNIPRVLLTQGLAKLWKGAYFAPTAPVSMRTFTPALPGPRWLSVKNRVCGICASDLHLLFVDLDPKVSLAALPGRDRIYLGHEVVSEVTEVGPEVTRFAPGDRVLMMSRFLGATCHSQEITPLCPACQAGDYCLCSNQAAGRGPAGEGGGWGDGYTCHESEIWPVPDALTDDQATLVEPLACGVRAVLRRPPRPGERVLVVGCGMIGLATLQAIRAAEPSAEVYAAARYPQQQALAREHGATLLEGDLYDATARLVGASVHKGPLFDNRMLLGGFDVIYDCVATSATVHQAVRLARAGGAVVMVGVHLKPSQLDLTPVLFQEVDLIGALAHGMETWEGERVSTFDLTARWLEQGKLSTEGYITHRFGLDRWKEAILTATDKKSGCIKVVFDL